MLRKLLAFISKFTPKLFQYYSQKSKFDFIGIVLLPRVPDSIMAEACMASDGVNRSTFVNNQVLFSRLSPCLSSEGQEHTSTTEALPRPPLHVGILGW